MTTQRDPIGWQYEYETLLHSRCHYWSGLVTEASAVQHAAHGRMTTGRVRPVYAGDAVQVRELDPDDERVPFP